jgi:eukaryotic-like serine/threonine-protein kinase
MLREDVMLVGQHIGPFAVEKELGAGAMGAVYLARLAETGQRVAIKVVAAGLDSNPTIMARFKRETAILKQLKHPNIVRLVATGKFQGTPYYAMEFIDGESLDRVIARRGRLTWEEVVEFGQQLCAALQHAHENGILHRDLKPSNVMILPNGTAKLTDFGIAKDLDRTQLTADHCTVGTASYMSPEQCKGERELTTRSDLYSMGVMFYELLTGRKPFVADDPMAMFMLHLNGTFERPSRRILDIPVWLDNLVCQLLEKQPDQRPVSAAMVGRALSQVKEKVLAQQSAGVDAARTRNVDRPRGQAKLEDEDKDAARTLLGRKKRKKKAVPIFQRRWFQGAILSLLLVGIVIVLARALRPPSPDELYAQASGIMEDSDPERWEHAKKPIDEFLERYPDHEKARLVRSWATRIEAQEQEDSLRRRMHLRHNLGLEFEPRSDAEGLAYQAVRYQDFGDLATARERWQELKKKTEKDASEKAWRLVAERKLEELKGKAPEPKNPKEAKAEAAGRVALVQKKVKEALKLVDAGKTTEARSLADDIVNLYGKNDALTRQVDEAKKVRAELAKAKGSS